VDAVDHRRAGPRHVPRDDLVGEDHRLLDHVGRLGPLAHLHLDGRDVVLGQDDLGLDRLEVEPAARDTPLTDRTSDAVESAQRPLALLVGKRLLAVQIRLDGLVVEAAVGTDDRGRQPVGLDHGVGRKVHDHRERQAVLIRVERADLVGELLGQHRQDAVDKIHTRCAPARLAVERGVPRHVVRDIGDVHAETYPSVDVLDADRVVEIPRIDRVDRDRERVAQVRTVSRSQSAVDVEPLGGGLGEHVLGELGAQAVLRMMTSISSPGSPSLPRTSSTTPWAAFRFEGYAVSRATTMSPSVAPAASRDATNTSVRMRGSVGTTMPTLP
jgi:hypothetical protein